MAICPNGANTINTTQTTTVTKGLIKTTVKRIDQMQKEAKLQSACEGCEGSLFANIYNTKPVNFYLCNGTPFTVYIPDYTGTAVNVFRIEDVREDGVILRLLTVADGVVTCTEYTAILDLDCVCGMQCYPAICCEQCSRNCSQTTA